MENNLANRLRNSMAFLAFSESNKNYGIKCKVREKSWLSTLKFHIKMTHYDSLICKLAIERLSVLNELVESNMACEFESRINLEIQAIESALQSDTVDLAQTEAEAKFLTGGILDSHGLEILPGLQPSKYENIGVITPSNVFRTAHWLKASEDKFSQIEQIHSNSICYPDTNKTVEDYNFENFELQSAVQLTNLLSKQF